MFSLLSLPLNTLARLPPPPLSERRRRRRRQRQRERESNKESLSLSLSLSFCFLLGKKKRTQKEEREDQKQTKTKKKKPKNPKHQFFLFFFRFFFFFYFGRARVFSSEKWGLLSSSRSSTNGKKKFTLSLSFECACSAPVEHLKKKKKSLQKKWRTILRSQSQEQRRTKRAWTKTASERVCLREKEEDRGARTRNQFGGGNQKVK